MNREGRKEGGVTREKDERKDNGVKQIANL